MDMDKAMMIILFPFWLVVLGLVALWLIAEDIRAAPVRGVQP